MAIKNLEAELEQIFQQIFKPGQLNPTPKGGKKQKSSGSEDPVRALLDLYSFRFNIIPSDIVEQILNYKVSTGKSVKSVKIFKELLDEGDRRLVENTANQIVKKFRTEKPAQSKNYNFSIKDYNGGVQLIFKTNETVSEQSIYNVANTLKKKVSEAVFSSGDGEQLFIKMSQNALAAKDGGQGEKLTKGGIFNVGHDHPVAKMSASYLQDGVDSVEGSELVSEEVQTIRKMVSNKLGTFNLDFSMAREAAVWKGGKLIPNPTSKFYVETNLETKFKNQVEAQGSEGARQVGEATGALLVEIRKYLKTQYKDAKGHVRKQASVPFIDQIGAGIVFHKSLKQLYTRKLAKNLTKWQTMPSDTKFKRTKNKTKKYKSRQTEASLNIGAPKGIKTQPRREKGAGGRQQDAIQQALVTRAFINSRLTKQVQGNMFRPGLENVSGRFAESVTITNASSNGNQSHFDYTYQKSPYQVFENGREYTPNYDPRPLIEKSIRELALQRMERTKFTLRRV